VTFREHSHGTAPRLKQVFWGSLYLACLCVCVPSKALSQTAPQRDQQALTILGQTIAVGGGLGLLTSIQDITETGTVKFDWDEEVTGSITIKGRGLREFRMDAELPEGRRSAVVPRQNAIRVQKGLGFDLGIDLEEQFGLKKGMLEDHGRS
jgi:hypothetical protein